MLQIFKNLKLGKRLPSTNLFVGPSQIKSTLMRLAKLILCDGNGCGVCLNCRLVDQSQHPDLVLVDATISVNETKEILRTLTLPPYYGDTKVCLIYGLSKSNRQALNAMLKILEEPPSYLIFFLLADNEASLPTTVLSRCVVWDTYQADDNLNPVLDNEIGQVVKDLGLEEDHANELVRRLDQSLETLVRKNNPLFMISVFEESQKKQRRLVFNLAHLIALKKFARDLSPEFADLVIKFQIALNPLERRYLNESAVLAALLLSSVEEVHSIFN